MAEGFVSGSNARVMNMLNAFRKVIADFECPPSKLLSRELKKHIDQHIQFLTDCRPFSMPMKNAVSWLKFRVARLNPSLEESEGKLLLDSVINTYVRERITLADQAIVGYAVDRISDGDVILVYSSSCVVQAVLLHAHEKGIKFRAVVVDAAPRNEGRKMLQRLLASGIRCSYANLHALSYLMPEVSKVFLGASSMLLNGTLVARIGTALVAMLAKERGVPVLVCCETYKFSETVLLDSICYNELGDPEQLLPPQVPGQPLNKVCDWRDMKDLSLLNLLYDSTPVKYITLVITEMGVIPPTSVPVVIREDKQRMDIAANEGI